MKDKIFLDSNVILYLLQDDKRKKEIVIDLVFSNPIISTQVINENINVCLKKFKLKREDLISHINLILNYCNVVTINNHTIELAIHYFYKFHYSYYDSLILASAFENECKIIFSENFQNNQVLENELTIVNPFQKN